MELRRLELEMIREMKKPNEDMCLKDHKVMELDIRQVLHYLKINFNNNLLSLYLDCLFL